MSIWIIMAVLIVAFDQLAKLIVVSTLSVTDSVRIIPGVIDFVFVKNTGAAFSILSDGTVLLSVVSVLFCIGVGVFWYVKKPKDKLLCSSLAMLFSGAMGNALDRIFRGFVVDFILAKFIDFPVFNIADIAITCGAALLIIHMLFFDKEDKNAKTDA